MSLRNPITPANEPGQMATVFVALAMTAGRPIQTSAGNERSVPPPAMELMTPAKNAATAMMMTLVRANPRRRTDRFAPSARHTRTRSHRE
jgi:hypothetical protein